ncbi:PrsW family intramembrane metalloprotease [Pyrococcus kukulkanii]|uniref:Protease PrsW n=1 Tax=Pyrococcus kukulkanii TaxID=1609559 RepID=A0ABV4T412_9EURY
MPLLTYLIFFAYAPALALLWYFYHQDRLEPEPKRVVINTFILGGSLSIAIAIVLESILVPRWFQNLPALLPATFFYTALVAGIVEEPAKAVAIKYAYNTGNLFGIMDGVIYGVAAGLGFAATENLLYGLGYGLRTTISRALLTPFAHATWSAIVGVGYGLKAEGKIHTVAPYFIMAMLLHFLWDYFAFLSTIVPLYSIMVWLLLLLNFLILRRLITLGKIEDMQRYWWYWLLGGRRW